MMTAAHGRDHETDDTAPLQEDDHPLMTSPDHLHVVLLQASAVMATSTTGIEVETDNMIEATATDLGPHLRHEEDESHTEIEIAKATDRQAIVGVEAGAEALMRSGHDESLHHRTRK
ncbi:hypothetical protein GJ744_011655 [Endocarpon pusillum]|uniref:Uncharacterized protein n=1 Tax=Endocarpon pusillum TaxID=364733 RepID=A0A8H7AFJ8_9EURO|nr:hypothetical protein GJ744_011655 [Endocarpon pusillum]